VIARRKVMLYLTEEQYLTLKRLATEKGSMAGVVRDWIDASDPSRRSDNPIQRHVRDREPGGEAASDRSRVRSSRRR
jgi:hypothetical protein